MQKSKSFIIALICLCTLVLLALAACGEKEKIRANVLPPVRGATLHFRGYVTVNPEELMSDIYYFKRTVTDIDTMAGHPVYFFYSDTEKMAFYTDEVGTVHQLNTLNLSDRLLAYDLMTPKPVRIKYWETLLKLDQGVGTKWNVVVDTTVQAIDSQGDSVQVRYFYSGKARYEGWGRAFIPETQTYERVLDVYWYELEQHITNETTGDSLFVKRGDAHHYFDPELGIVKYTTDYNMKERNGAYVARYGTWELMRRELPGSTF